MKLCKRTIYYILIHKKTIYASQACMFLHVCLFPDFALNLLRAHQFGYKSEYRVGGRGPSFHRLSDSAMMPSTPLFSLYPILLFVWRIRVENDPPDAAVTSQLPFRALRKPRVLPPQLDGTPYRRPSVETPPELDMLDG